MYITMTDEQMYDMVKTDVLGQTIGRGGGYDAEVDALAEYVTGGAGQATGVYAEHSDAGWRVGVARHDVNAGHNAKAAWGDVGAAAV